MPLRRFAVLALALVAWGLVESTPASAAETLSPSSPTFGYDAGPYTNVNVGGLLIGSCFVPEGCDEHPFKVDIPAGYYQSLREQGKVGVVEILATWPNNDDDFDLGLLDKDGNPIATSGFGNSTFERIAFTELPSGDYTIEMAVFRVANSSFHVQVTLQAMDPTPTSAVAGDGGMRFSNGSPVALERSSGEPNMEIGPNGDAYVDIPLGAGTNSILYKSTDNARTFKPLAPYHPNNNPLPTNLAGGGDSYTTIDKDGRVCFSELNTLLSLGIGCSTDGGKTFVPADPLVIDPTTPLVDRQWQAVTPQGEQFIAAQYGIVTVGPSQPGVRVHKEVVKGTNLFTQVAEVDTGKAMKSYNMVADPSDTGPGGGTVAQIYLRPNEGPDKADRPHELMIWYSTDGLATDPTLHTVAKLQSTPGNNFASMDIDKAGNVYVSWSEQGTWDIFYTVAKKGDLGNWSEPVRVNLEPAGRTAIQSTIKVGDPGRVFVGFYAAEQYGNPDALPGGEWHAYLSYALDGDCQLDGSCTNGGKPTFRQTRITDHVMQDRGICLGGTGCGGDPYYGDRSMLEFLDIAFAPSTGQVHVVTTDSSRTNTGTTITVYRQVAGPSAFAGKPAVADGTGVNTTASVSDVKGDAAWPYESPVPATLAPGADILNVSYTRPDEATMRITMELASADFRQAMLAGVGTELLIATRFATPLDVFWVGLSFGATDSAPSFVGGHLNGGLLVDSYANDATAASKIAGKVTGSTITMDVPLSVFKTTLQQPATVEADPPVVAGVTNGTPLYAVTGISFVGLQSHSDAFAKHWLDVAPAFNVSVLGNTSTALTGSGGGAGGTGGAPIPATGSNGVDGSVMAVLLALGIGAAVLRRRVVVRS